MKHKFWTAGFSLVSMLSLALAGCAGDGGVGDATPYPTPVRTTYEVRRGDIVVDVELFGRVAPLALHTVYFQMSGHVSEVYVQLNSVVEEGQLLAELVELRDLQLRAASTNYEIRRAEIDLETAQLLLTKYRAEGRARYDIRIQELQVELAQMALAEVLAKHGLDPAAYALEDPEAQVAPAKVFSPADGVVISAVSPGRAISPTTVAFVIGDGEQLEIVAEVDATRGEEQLQNMFEGMPVLVTPNDNPSLQWQGKIRQLPSPYGTGSSNVRTVNVVLDERPDEEEYLAGDTVTLFVRLADKKGVLWLPPEAVRQVGGRTFVIASSESGPKRIDIEVGLVTRDKVEILSGLDEGQVVIGP